MRRITLSLTMCMTIVLAGVSAEAATAPKRTYIVVLKDGTSPPASLTRRNLTATHIYRHALLGYAVNLTDSQATSLRAAAEVESVNLSGTTSVGPSLAKKADPPPPPQPPQIVGNAIRRVGGLDSQTAKIDGVDDSMPIDIAILDTGIDSTHPDLDVAGGVDCGPGSGWEDVDPDGHGTMVAGFAAAVDNAIGVVGVAPGARVWSVRVADKRGHIKDSDLICGIDWVTANSHVIDIANGSLSGDGPDTGNCGIGATKRDAGPVHQAVCASVASGVAYFFAAGNESADATLSYPANYDEVVAVSAISDKDGQSGGLGGQLNCLPSETDDTFATYSNFGADVDIAAPGSCISSTFPGGQYAVSSGTSFATPIVSGAAALYLVNNPNATPADVRSALIALAEPGPIPGDPDAFPEGVVHVSEL